MDAKVTVEYKVRNVCTKQDLIDMGMSLDEMVRDLIREDHIIGLADGEPEIVKVEEIGD